MNESQLDRIEHKLDVNTRQTTENTFNLREHMRRTLLLEERVAPIEEHVARWAGIGKAVAIIGSLLVAAAAVLKIFEHF